MRISALVSLLPFFLLATADPGGHETRDVIARRKFLTHAKRSINGCRDKIEARGIDARAIERRAALAESLRSRRGLPQRRAIAKRDFAAVLATDHESNRIDLTSTSSGVDVFTGDLACVLQPEVTIGPYWVSGELVRSDVRDGEAGIPLFADYQIIDVSTCEPIPNVYLDTWHANATGVYSGVVASGNGDNTDTTNLNSTHGRGLQLTDSDGVAYFETNFPGHYTGRTPHIHVLATLNATLLANNTISGGNVAHIGQVFFDQSLITSVSENEPYAGNTQTLTVNSNDSIMGEEAAVMDPVAQYVWLGSDLSDGILSWITIGVDPTAAYVTTAASAWTENGGVANANAGGAPGGDAPGGGAAPSGSGAPPSGSGVPPSGSGAPPTGSVAPTNSAAPPTDSASAASTTDAAASTTDAATSASATDSASTSNTDSVAASTESSTASTDSVAASTSKAASSSSRPAASSRHPASSTRRGAVPLAKQLSQIRTSKNPRTVKEHSPVLLRTTSLTYFSTKYWRKVEIQPSLGKKSTNFPFTVPAAPGSEWRETLKHFRIVYTK